MQGSDRFGKVTFKYHSLVQGRNSDGSQRVQCESVEAMHDDAIENSRSMLARCAEDDIPFMPTAFMYTPDPGEVDCPGEGCWLGMVRGEPCEVCKGTGKVDAPKVNVILLAEGFEGQAGKEYTCRALSRFAAKRGATALVMCLDGWQLQPPDGLTKEEALEWVNKAGRPSKHPDRRECLTVNLVYPDARVVEYAVEYERWPRLGKGEDIIWREVRDQRDGRGQEYVCKQYLVPAWDASEGAKAKVGEQADVDYGAWCDMSDEDS